MVKNDTDKHIKLLVSNIPVRHSCKVLPVMSWVLGTEGGVYLICYCRFPCVLIGFLFSLFLSIGC
jgi:hypothetical protein